jgi:hypothetical protein
MTHDELPPLSAIDRKDKLLLWLATEVFEQGKWDLDEIYELLESHFALVSTWRKLQNRSAMGSFPLNYQPTETRMIERF